MKMNDTVARIVEIMFQDVEMNEETAAIRDEVMNNCQERYNDLINSGMSEDDAIAAVIESLKGMDDVLAPYKRKAHRHTENTENDENTEDNEEEEETGERELIYAAQEIHGIDLTLINEDVSVEASDDEDFHVLWNADENPLLDVHVEHGELKVERRPGEIKTRKDHIEIHIDGFDDMIKSLGQSMKNIFSKNGSNFSISFADSSVTIQVPVNAMPHVKLLTTSGDIEVQEVSLADLSITTTSGDIDVDLDGYDLSRADIRTTSGDVEASVFAPVGRFSSTSGDVEVEGRIGDLTVATISGDIDVRADVVNMNFKAVSGDVNMQFDSDELRSINGNTVSGDVEIELPDGIGQICINLRSRSGDTTTRYSTNDVGPTVTGSVTSISGDITLR